jgi:hypothetical protein
MRLSVGGSTSNPTPTRPSATPPHGQPGRFPWATSHSTSHSGTVATNSDVIPELTRCSAHETAPLPINSRSAPTMAELRHSSAVGAAAPRHLTIPYIKLPATRNRTAPIAKGGIVATPQRIAR